MNQKKKVIRIQSNTQPRRGFTTTSEERRANLFAWRPSDVGAKSQRGFTSTREEYVRVFNLHGIRTPSKQTRRGFTLLLAVLVSSILIALGSAIFDIVIKEITLSSSGRESQFAFYSADTGIECALYWDLKQNAFATTSNAVTVKCGGIDAALTRTLTNQGTVNETYTTTFSFPLATAAPCTSVRVIREHYPVRTTIESSGYNTCITTNPLRLERTIRVRY